MSENAKTRKEKKFDKAFFDSGKDKPGTFSHYSFNNYCLTFKPLCEIVKKHFNPQRVLDVGCAKGSLVFAFRQLGIEAYGVDVSSYAISCAPDFLQPFLQVVDLDEDSLPFLDEFFDFVTFFGSIEYLHNHQRIVGELERVMADGGTLLLTTINKRPKGDVFRINVHNKASWLREFGQQWKSPYNYHSFMSDYFRKVDGSVSVLGKMEKKLSGRTKFTDIILIKSRDFLVSLKVLNYLIILLSYQKNNH